MHFARITVGLVLLGLGAVALGRASSALAALHDFTALTYFALALGVGWLAHEIARSEAG